MGLDGMLGVGAFRVRMGWIEVGLFWIGRTGLGWVGPGIGSGQCN